MAPCTQAVSLAHTTNPGPPPFNFTVPQGGIAVARSSNGGRTFGPISVVLTDQELQGMNSRGMTPKGIGNFGVNPFDRPWIAVDQSTGAVYVSTTAHPQRYVAVSPTRAERGDGSRRSTAMKQRRPTPITMSPAVRIPNRMTATSRPRTASSRPCTRPAPRPAAPAPARCSRPAQMQEPIGPAMSSPTCRPRPVCSSPPTRRTRAASRCCSDQGSVAGGLAGLPASKNVPQEVQVVTTANSGSTWSTPTTLGNESVEHITNRPWIAYGPTGVLAVCGVTPTHRTTRRPSWCPAPRTCSPRSRATTEVRSALRCNSTRRRHRRPIPGNLPRMTLAGSR